MCKTNTPKSGHPLQSRPTLVLDYFISKLHKPLNKNNKKLTEGKNCQQSFNLYESKLSDNRIGLRENNQLAQGS